MSPAFFGDADIQAMIDGLGGVLVEVGGVAALGLYQAIDNVPLVGEAASFVGRRIEVLVKSGTFPGLAEGVAIVVDGVKYQVTATALEEDGAVTRVSLARLPS